MAVPNKKRFSLFLIALGIAVLPFLSCSGQRGDRSARYTRLKAHIDKIKVIDTHEHQSTYLLLSEKKVNFFSLLSRSYINDDLISAGAPRVGVEEIEAGDHEKLWKRLGLYLDFSRNTSYYKHLVSGFKLLYGFGDDYFTEENTKTLSPSITRNYAHFAEWYDSAFNKAGFEMMFVDPHWDNFKLDKFYENFALVMRLDPFINSISERTLKEQPDAPKNNNPFYQAKQEGQQISGLDGYLGYADKWFRAFVRNSAVCAKSANAYQRSIDYEEVNYKEAAELFRKPSAELNTVQKKKLQDFMFHWCVEKCTEYDLPLQIHTGYLAGNWKSLEQGRPFKLNNLLLKYPNTKFILLHGGYPWYPEVGVLAKNFPNVYLDIVWLPQISRAAAADALHQWLDSVPYNKFFWGGDCSIIEGSAGALVEMRDVLAQVLAERVDGGQMSLELAEDMAVKILRENAIRVFQMEKKLGRFFQ